MAGQKVIQCVGPSYQLADRKTAVQRSVNLYIKQVEGLGENNQIVLASINGLTTKVDLGATTRGAYSTDTRRFVVAGTTLYERDTAGGAIVRGTLASGSGPVSMRHGTSQLMIVDGSNGYVFDLNANTLTQVSSGAWRGSYTVDEYDGYFIFAAPDTQQFYLSAIDDGLTYNALDFSSADARPGNIVTLKVHKHELVLFCTDHIEYWVDSGANDFPLVRYNSTPVDVGIVGKRALVRAADTLIFVGQTERGTAIVYMMVGHQPVRISDQAVEEALKTSTDLSQCVMWAYQDTGNEFVGISAPGMQTTRVYDAASKQWHEQAELVNGEWEPIRIDTVTHFSGEHYATAGTVDYLVDKDSYTLGSDPLVRERTWPHFIGPASEMVSYRSLELQCTTGYGGNITLEVSNDGGVNFGPPLKRSLGAIGRWMQRVRWFPLGSAIDRVFRLRCSDAVPLTIRGANVDAG